MCMQGTRATCTKAPFWLAEIYQQHEQSYQQQHPNSQANIQQRQQSFNQDRSSGSFDSQSMNSDMQNRMNGASSSDHFNPYHPSGRRSGGGGWGGSHSWRGFGGGRELGWW